MSCLAQTADAGQRPTTVRDRDGHQDLAGPRCIRDPNLHGVEVAAHEGRILVAERNIERGSRATALLRGRDQGGTPTQCRPHGSAHAGVQDRRRMFEFTILADERRLAVALGLVARDAERRNGPRGQEPAEFAADRS